MATILDERVAVTVAPDGGRTVVHTLWLAGGVDMSGTLSLPPAAARWLAERLDVGDALPPEVTGPDGLRVFLGGTDWQPFVHVHRDVPDGPTQALGLTTACARELAALLRA